MSDKDFSFNATIFPASINATTDDVLQKIDPTLYQISLFFSQILESNINPAFSNVMIAVGLTNANNPNIIDGYAVGEVISFPLDETLFQENDFKFPLLSIYTEKEEYDQLTLTNSAIKRDIVVDWILPPMSAAQRNLVDPFLQAASKSILAFGQQGYDPKVNPNSPSIWEIAKISFGSINSCDHIYYKNKSSPTMFEAIEIRLSIWEKNILPTAQNPALPLFTSLELIEDVVNTGDPGNPILDFIDGYITPGIGINSITPSSGDIFGNTLLVITGFGFTPYTSLSLCGIPVKQLVVVSPILIKAISNAGSIDGEGDVVIINTNLGEEAILTNGFSYTG